jgi:NADH-quinone oxidoreductase subunit M
MPTLLLILLGLPLATAVAVALVGYLQGPPTEGRRAPASSVRWLSLGSTLASLVLVLVVAVEYAGTVVPERATANLQHGLFVTEPIFAPAFVPGATEEAPHATTWDVLELGRPITGQAPAIQFYIGVDGLNIWLLVLTCFLMVPCVLVSWKSIEERIPEFFAWLLVLQTAMLGVFLSFDIVLFYVFFELTLVPLFFLIGIWGGPQRQYAARKFFIFTLAGSLFTLLGVLAIALVLAQDGAGKRLTFSIPELARQVEAHGKDLQETVRTTRAAAHNAGDRQSGEAARKAEADWSAWQRVQLWVFLALIAGFAIKVPLVPVHTWLPLAHTEAPTAGSVLLAGVLLKIGSYGFLRLCLPLTPDASAWLGVPLVATLSVIGIIYGSFCALAQHDIKKLVAYSSVAHMGFTMIGLFALNEVGVTGSVLQMLNHGLSTGALFLLVGMLYERYHTRKMSDYGGMGAKLKLLAFFFCFITMTSIGLPGLNGFVGEMLVLFGMYGYEGSRVGGRFVAGLATTGVVLGAWYMLTLVMKVFFGEVREPEHAGHAVGDLDGREVATLAPIALACLFLGLYPQPVIDAMRPEVRRVARLVAQSQERVEAVASPAASAPGASGKMERAVRAAE